jgi:Zn-dependent protease with chaperone function
VKRDVEELRARGERDLAKILLADPLITKLIERYQEKRIQARRYLLGTSVRLTESMAPDIHAVASHCRETLGLVEPLEIYVSPSPSFNAFSYGREGERVIVGTTSALLEAFASDELKFVVGHELSHYMFRHHDVPVGALVRGRSGVKPKQAIQLFQWQRYAEISSDRAGLVCAGSLAATGRAFFKIASGLKGTSIRFDIDTYLEQVGDIEEEAAKERKSRRAGREEMRTDWFASHPFSPLRVRAAQLCSESVICREDGMSVDELESKIQALMSLMEPSYLMDDSASGEAMRRLLFAGGVLVASAVDGISDEELEALKGFLGEGLPSELNVDTLREDLDRRVEFAIEHVPSLKIAQVVRDLAVIAMADGHQAEEELEVIYDLADRLGIDRMVVERTVVAARSDLD